LNKGKLYLIPTTLGKGTEKETIPLSIVNTIKKIDIFIVENLRTARRYIKKIEKNKDIDKTIFYCYGKHNTLSLEKDFLPHILDGKDIGLLSEAGVPCIADPGAKIVSFAHDFQIDITPLVGPSSIFLALMASGMNGQNFTFHGYLPINKLERKRKIKDLEKLSKKKSQTQIFMETPYRNMQLINTILNTCSNNTKLCIASDITLSSERIKTKVIGEWKETIIDIHKKPTIFLIG
tara:strand:+ start:121 stop:825 length:705 start_codon:yes stop_codon:yes gene_type:complete